MTHRANAKEQKRNDEIAKKQDEPYQKKQLENKYHECARRSKIFLDDVLTQIGRLSIQDYENLNLLGLLVEELNPKSKKKGD